MEFLKKKSIVYSVYILYANIKAIPSEKHCCCKDRSCEHDEHFAYRYIF